MNNIALIFVGLSLVLVLVILGLKWRGRLDSASEYPVSEVNIEQIHIVHRLCPQRTEVQPTQQYNELEMKDSLDEHLDVLTKKLADKEGRLLLSKSKIRESLNEIENLHAIDEEVKTRYRDIMETLRLELQNNEKDCKKLQEQIEWVSHRRAELEDEVHQEQMIYEEATPELSNNLVEISSGRKSDQGEYYHPKLMDKPKLQFQSLNTVRCRKEPYLPSPVPALVGKTSHHHSSVESMLVE